MTLLIALWTKDTVSNYLPRQIYRPGCHWESSDWQALHYYSRVLFASITLPLPHQNGTVTIQDPSACRQATFDRSIPQWRLGLWRQVSYCSHPWCSCSSQHLISLSLGFSTWNISYPFWILLWVSPCYLNIYSFIWFSAEACHLVSISGFWKGAGDTLMGEHQPLHSFWN